jgi:hypothetical protein
MDLVFYIKIDFYFIIKILGLISALETVVLQVLGAAVATHESILEHK